MPRFNAPPNWPTAPAGWTPPVGWQPPSEWGPVPFGWQLWVEDARPEKVHAKAEVRQAKRAAKVEARRVRAAHDAAVDELVGELVARGSFGGSLIEIYSHGYVRQTTKVWVPKDEPFVPLTSLTSDADSVVRKNGLARGVLGVATLGVSTYASPLRGDVYLTIVSSRGVTVLHQTATPECIQLVKTLEAVAAQVLPTRLTA